MESVIYGSLMRRIVSYTKNSQRHVRLLKNSILANTERTLPSTRLMIKRNFRTSSALEKIYYTTDHEWINVDGDVGTVGITKYAKELLGDITFCELPDVGAQFEKGDTISTIESVKAANDLFAPISGEVLECSGEIADDPSVMNGEEFDVESVWLVKMKLSNSCELDELMNEEEYKKYKEESEDY